MNFLNPDSMEYLNTISIETASKCNLKCKMCSHPGNKRKLHFMEMDEFKKIINKFLKTKIRRLLFNMGEPLMNKNLFEMIKYSKEKGFFVYISSNGQMLNEEIIKKVLSTGVDAIKISIEGYTKEVYENIRIGGDFDTLFRNVVRLNELKNRYQSSLYLWISTIIMKGNEDLVEFIKFWGPYCDDIELTVLTDHIGLVKSNREISLSDKWTHRKNCPQIKPYKEINILSNGDMVICCVDFHARCKFGNLLNQDLEDIWSTEKMRTVRSKAYSGEIPSIDPCSDCHISDNSDILKNNLQKSCSQIHKMVKDKRWTTLNKISSIKNKKEKCTSCNSPLLISFDGVCSNCIKKEPYNSIINIPRQLKIMIMGDSFGMPRPFKMNNKIELLYQQCYPQLLDEIMRKQFLDGTVMVINNCKRANTSLGILHDLKNPRFGEIYLNQPDYLIIQVGNVDCFERTRHHDEFAPIAELRGKNPWISCIDFIRIQAEIIKETLFKVSGLKGILIVNIPPIKKENSKKNAATQKRISQYNAKLKMFNLHSIIHILDIYKLFYLSQKDPYSSDGIHPNSHGSRMLAELIFNKIKELETK